MSKLLSPNHPARKKLRRWHNLCGLAVALLLILSGASGSLLAYKKPILKSWLSVTLPAHYSQSDIASDLESIAGQFPPTGIGLLKAPNEEEPYWQLIQKQGERYLLEPTTLKPLADNHWLLHALEWVRVFHTELLAGIGGELVLFAMSLLTLFLLLSGVLLWWPARKRMQLRWVLPGKLRPRHLIQYHRHSGAVSMLLILLVILTGTIMLEQRLEHWLEGYWLDNRPAPTAPTPVTLDEQHAVSTLIQSAVAQLPQAWPTYIRLPSEQSDKARVRFRLPGEWHPNGRTSVEVNAHSAEILPFQRSDQMSTGKRLMNLLYPLHSGYGLNAIYQFLVFISGVVCCWLAGTGFIHWWRTR